ESTERTLRESGCPDNTVLILDSHHNAPKYVKEKIRAGMFNLGYMPGSGNKSLTTRRETTIPAVKNAIGMLGKDAILLVAVYPGHEEGRLEGEEIREMLSGLSKYTYTVGFFRLINSPDAPYFMIVETK
ncbi:MAG: class I SAM-dependent methyltransferase, partial [Clostridia bacterium]|nr:class I SAM-dependent methyltransferase [Clostridia bacterium]